VRLLPILAAVGSRAAPLLLPVETPTHVRMLTVPPQLPLAAGKVWGVLPHSSVLSAMLSALLGCEVCSAEVSV
jgi:hypothetical protein